MSPDGDWRYVFASTTGTSHIDSGLPCQDAAGSTVISAGPEGAVYLSVASDGAGSAARSAEGAATACDLMLAQLGAYVEGGGSLSDITRDEALGWVEAVRRAIATAADEAGLTARDYACTLLAAAVGPDHAFFLQVGDGAIVIGDAEGYAPVFWPQSGEYANVTYFVTDATMDDHLQVEVRLASIDEIALFTDGLQMLALKFDTQTAHPPFFRPMFARLRTEPAGWAESLAQGLSDFLNSEGINLRTDDDKTLSLATRIAPGPVA